MKKAKRILVINGSASRDSSNQVIIDHFKSLAGELVYIQQFNELRTLPHFDPEQSISNPPPEIVALRAQVSNADGVLICTPEYVFSIPSGLKNVIEWCVATTVFSNKPVGLITASASGQKAHKELQLLMKTLMADFTSDTTLLIRGIKGKTNIAGELTDENTKKDLAKFTTVFLNLLQEIKY